MQSPSSQILTGGISLVTNDLATTSTLFAAKPHIYVESPLAVIPIYPSPSIVERKLAKRRGLRTRCGRKNNFSSTAESVTVISSYSKSIEK